MAEDNSYSYRAPHCVDVYQVGAVDQNPYILFLYIPVVSSILGRF